MSNIREEFEKIDIDNISINSNNNVLKEKSAYALYIAGHKSRDEELQKWRIRNDKQEARIIDQDEEIKKLNRDCKNLVDIINNQAEIVKAHNEEHKRNLQIQVIQQADNKKLRNALINIKEAYPPEDLDPWEALDFCMDIAQEALKDGE